MSLPYRILRNYRGYILPSHHRTFEQVVRAGTPQPGDEQRKFVFFDFTSSEIDLDAGRYIFALVRDFEEIGYTAAYRKHFPFLSNMRYKRYKALLLERPYRVVDSISALPSVAAVVTDRKRISYPGKKLVRVSYSIRQPASQSELVMPFRPYPKLYPHVPDSIEGARPWRIFFAGTINKRYARATLKIHFGKMSRVEILNTLTQNLRRDEIHVLTSEKDAAGGRKFFWGAKNYRIALENWFPTLAKADFFLACPGGAMPICHNIVEAMAAGVVPILEYPEYLDPPLRHGVNCLVFNGAAGLLEVVRLALKTSEGEIVKMRNAARVYYREWLAPGMFARRVLETREPELTLLFNAHLAPRA